MKNNLAVHCDVDSGCCKWLEKLVQRGLILDGLVLNKSITDCSPEELKDFTRVHLFAGIGGWDLSLQMAGWPEDEPVWTGSCPCQPFSSAGKKRGVGDERHLWPEMRRLIEECRPSTVLGEQVASRDGRNWLATVRTDLEELGYAVGAADLCAAGVGAPHIRQRLFWVAYSDSRGQQECEKQFGKTKQPRLKASRRNDTSGCSDDGGLGDANGNRGGRDCRSGLKEKGGPQVRSVGDAAVASGSADGMANGDNEGFEGGLPRREDSRRKMELRHAGCSSSAWSDVEYIQCRDGKARPVKPGVQLLANGVQRRVAKLRGLGNAIVPQLASVFIKSFMELKNES